MNSDRDTSRFAGLQRKLEAESSATGRAGQLRQRTALIFRHVDDGKLARPVHFACSGEPLRTNAREDPFVMLPRGVNGEAVLVSDTPPEFTLGRSRRVGIVRVEHDPRDGDRRANKPEQQFGTVDE